jgi:ferredoxin-type protein NapH
MIHGSNFLKHRKAKQLLMSIAFVFILTGGWFFPLLGYFIPACMLLGVSIAMKRGRKWCDWYCPRGSFWDYMIKGLPVRIAVLTLLMAMMVIQIAKRWPDPYKIGAFFVAMLTATTLLGIIAAFFFHQRIWCYVCPIGSLSNWVGRNKHMLTINSAQCVECKLCAKVCPVQIRPYTFKTEALQAINDFDCLKCGSCVAVCPKKALSIK